MKSRTTLRRNRRSDRLPLRPAFTLVEMLVAVALVLLMMSMFAQIFQMAGSSISKQRGLAENDQRSRTLQTIIKADLDKRTFRWVYPFAAFEDPNAAESKISQRQGFFYVSENDPYNSLDDVLHFTVMSTITVRNTDDSPYFGQALLLPDPTTSGAVQSPFVNLPNQPDADDGQLIPNNTGQSTAAEVVYFVRNGNLYRRQLLIREPLAFISSRTQPDDGPASSAGNNLFAPTYTTAPGYASLAAGGIGTFLGDYDYSAYFDVNGAGVSIGAQFLGVNALDNSGSSLSALANPGRRFGFAPFLPAVLGTNSGRPKEFASVGTIAFIGRFTMQECSDTDFQYPQGLTTSGQIPTNPSNTLTLDSSNAVSGPDDFRQGIRRGEDLLLSNVHAFDVQIWDQSFGGFVNIGDPTAGDYSYNRRNPSPLVSASAGFGPRTSETFPTVINAVFDTWHPNIATDYDGDGATFESPPYRPTYFKPKSVTGAATDIAGWTPNYGYSVGDLVFPSGPPRSTIGSLPWNTKMPDGYPFLYRCVVAGTSAGSGPTDYSLEPNWPKVDGMTYPDNTCIWEAVDNRKPLKAIKITIRFVDPSTQQMRQMTLIHSLVDS